MSKALINSSGYSSFTISYVERSGTSSVRYLWFRSTLWFGSFLTTLKVTMLPYLDQFKSKLFTPGFCSSRDIGGEYPSTISNFLILILSFLSTIIRYGNDYLYAPGWSLIFFSGVMLDITGCECMSSVVEFSYFLEIRFTLRQSFDAEFHVTKLWSD